MIELKGDIYDQHKIVLNVTKDSEVYKSVQSGGWCCLWAFDMHTTKRTISHFTFILWTILINEHQNKIDSSFDTNLPLSIHDNFISSVCCPQSTMAMHSSYTTEHP